MSWIGYDDRVRWSKPVPLGSAEHFQQAKDDLDDARRALESAQTRFIHAERRYHDASRAYMDKWMSN
jgi:hypothetical protein